MRQTRGALKFLLADYRAVLKFGLLAMAFSGIAISTPAMAIFQSLSFAGTMKIDGVEVTPDTSTVQTSFGEADKSFELVGSSNTVDYEIYAGFDSSFTDENISLYFKGSSVLLSCDPSVDDTLSGVGIHPGYNSIPNGGYTPGVVKAIYLGNTDGSSESVSVITPQAAVTVYGHSTLVEIKAKNILLNSTADASNSVVDSHGAVILSSPNRMTDLNPPTLRLISEDPDGFIQIVNSGTLPVISFEQSGVLDVIGNFELIATDTVNTGGAILLHRGGLANINTAGTYATRIKGDVFFDQADMGLINLNVTGSNSYWTGNLYTKAVAEEQVATGASITLANGGIWNVTTVPQESPFRTLIMAQNLTFNGGVINLPAGSTTKVSNLSGTGGTFNVMSELNDDGNALTDYAKFIANNANISNVTVNLVNNQDLSKNTLTADRVSNAEAVMTEAAKAVTAGSGNIDETIVIAEGNVNGEVVATITRKSTGNGQLIANDPAVNPDHDNSSDSGDSGNQDSTVKPDQGNTDIHIDEKPNTKQEAFKAVTAMNFMQWRHDMNDLNKRMGELRDSAEGVGVWARAYGSEHKYGSQSVTSKNNSIQLGSDFDAGSGWKVGGAFTYTDGDSSYDNGRADNKAYGFAAYGAYFADNGIFVDLIAKYSRMSSDFNLGNMKGDMDNNALSFSAEVGWNIPFAGIAFVEPQVELSYGVVFGDTDTTSNGVRLKEDDAKTLIGRTGFRTGLHFNEGKGNIYARASVLHDFDGDIGYTATSDSTSMTFTDDLGGTYYEFGLGGNYKFSSNCYTYVDLERQTHGPVAEKWRWNIGMRYVF